ncbi:hypothetical protein [Thiocapsa sp.]|uniref:hypothetical protein n=1 Tax=Thiocapsa sp. TaxID=2024551 RepID=UPI002CCE9F6C|nr:hypothetical protein [Thiocapsa sp.]HSO84433.1 hypothetical protein [Thiocapsa sp.]
MSAVLEHRVDRLEEALEAFTRSVGVEFNKAYNGQVRLQQEMLEFKDEMRVFKGEMIAFKDEMKDFKDEMSVFKDEMIAFKDESLRYREEAERDRKSMNRQWGELANRLGTLVEDIVAPNLPRVARDLLGCPQPDLFGLRMRRRINGESREYDALLVCPELVLINQTKSRLISASVDDLLRVLAEFPEVFPEYADRRLIGVLASLYPDPSIINYATSKGVLVMGMGDETMDVLNPSALRAG